MGNIYEDYRQRLFELSDEGYRQFNIKLSPGIDNIIGVRAPEMKKLAKQLARDDWRSYFSLNEDKYFEETQLQGLCIGFLKEDGDTVFAEVMRFLPKINGWAMCDTFCSGLKLARKEPQRYWDLALESTFSDKPFFIRFGVVMMMSYFIDSEHIDEILNRFAAIRHDEYYVKMGVAWAVSVCFIKQRSKTLEFLKSGPMDDFTFNKSIQKIRESFRVSDEDKEMLKQMKRKG